MVSLLAVGSRADTVVDDLVWPAVAPDFLIRLETDEVSRWRGLADVSEYRYSREQADWKRVWQLEDAADCLITDRRLTYRASRLQRGTGFLAGVAAGLRQAHPTVQPASLLVGQIRFQWPINIMLETRRLLGVTMAVISVTCVDQGVPLRILLALTTKTSGRSPELVAADVARGLVSDIARFRLVVQSTQLTTEETRQLTQQRDDPTTNFSGSSMRWDLPGALAVGQPLGGLRAIASSAPKVSRQRPQVPEVPEGFEPALKAFAEANSPDAFHRAVERYPVLLTEDMDEFLSGRLDQLADNADPEILHTMETWRGTLRRWRASGPDAAIDYFIDGMVQISVRTDPSIATVSLFRRLVRAGTQAEARTILQEHPELLQADALARIDRFIDDGGRDADGAAATSAYRTLLQRCLDIGIDAAVRDSGLFDDTDAQAEPLTALHEAAGAAMDRYSAFGQAEDLETAMRHGRQLLEEMTTDSPDRLTFLNFYAGVLATRFDRFGDLSDLTAAIDIIREVADRTEHEAPEFRPAALSNLGRALLQRFERTLAEDDQVQAVAAFEAAITLTPRSSDDWPDYASNLGEALRARHLWSDDPADLDRAVQLQEEVVAREPPDSPRRARYLVNLGNILSERERVRDNPADLDRAITAYQAAFQLLSGPARGSGPLNELANALARRHERTGQSDDLTAAVAAWRESCALGQDSSQGSVLLAARNWSRAVAENGQDWTIVTEACAVGLAAADRLFRMQLTREHKGLWLEDASDLPPRAAYALAKLNRLEEAVATLEGGRARLFAEALERNHADLERLAEFGRGDLSDRYRRAAEHLARYERDEPQPDADPDALPGPESRTEALRTARAELDRVITDIRAVDGYERFLAPPSYAEIAAAVADTPIAYVATTEPGGLALIVGGSPHSKPTPDVVWLDELTDTTVSTMVETYLAAYGRQQLDREEWQQTLDRMAQQLWDILMGPLLEALSTDQVTIVAGGLLGLLPLHAAWTEDPRSPTGRHYALDDAVVNYVPSARALNAARRMARRTEPDGILAVYDSTPTLRHTEPEIRAALSWFSRGAQLRRNQTTRAAVLVALPHFEVLHFSCHGVAEVDNPLASRLLVARDGDITVQDFLEERLTGCRLAVLSACETAVFGGQLPDEVVSLPTGLLQAGVAGVVGSLWPVSDAATRALMTRFYELWRGDGLEPAEALRHAQRWLRDGETTDSVAGPHDYWHPEHWAGFTYVGV